MLIFEIKLHFVFDDDDHHIMMIEVNNSLTADVCTKMYNIYDNT